MRAWKCFLKSFVYTAILFGSATCETSLGNGGGTTQAVSETPSRGAILEAFLNYLFTIYPSTDSGRWVYPSNEVSEFTQGTPKRLYYAPRAGKRSDPTYEDEMSGIDETKSDFGETRWKRNAINPTDEEHNDRMKREVSSTNDISNGDTWSFAKADVRRSPFSPRLGKRDGDNDDGETEEDGEDINDYLIDDGEGNRFALELVAQDYADDFTVPGDILKRNVMTFSPRLGKRTAFIPRLGKRDFKFAPRLGKRGDFTFYPRLGKKSQDTSTGNKRKGGFPFVPRPGKKADFTFYPRLGKRGDFSFSPRLGKKADFAFRPRLGKRGRSFIPRLGKRSFSSATMSSNDAETLSPQEDNELSNSNNVN